MSMTVGKLSINKYIVSHSKQKTAYIGPIYVCDKCVYVCACTYAHTHTRGEIIFLFYNVMTSKLDSAVTALQYCLHT